MSRAIAENKTHYLQTTGVPRLRELIAAKLRDKNHIPVDDPEHVLVTNGGIHGVYMLCQALLEPGDEVHPSRSGVAARDRQRAGGQRRAGAAARSTSETAGDTISTSSNRKSRRRRACST